MEDKDYDKILKLIDLTQNAFVFILDGALFKGDIVRLAKKYVNENPDKKFRTWLIDKGFLIVDSFDSDYIEPKRVYKSI